jgi:hypothetical protein
MPLQIASSVVTFSLFVIVVRLALTNRRRAAERYVVPLLLRSLSPMQPTLQELETVIGHLRAQPLLLARALQPAAIHNRLAMIAPGDLLVDQRMAA